MRSAWKVFLTVLVAAALAGCGNASLSTSFDDDDGDFRPGDGTTNGPFQPGDSGATDQPSAHDGYSCVLIPEVGGERQVGLGGSVDLGVFVYSLDTGDVLRDIEVTYNVDEDISTDDVQLSARRSFSDEEGRAAVRVGGSEPGPFAVELETICSRTLVIEGEILELPTGDLEVSFNYPQRNLYEIRPLDVRLFDDETYQCSHRGNPQAITGWLQEEEAANVDASVTFRGVPVETTYTAVAIGYGQHGEVAAVGCRDGLIVPEDGTLETEIDIQLQPLDPGGVYDVTSHWDFSAALTEFGPVGSILLEIIAIAENPGQGLYDFLINRIQDFVGGVIGSLLDQFLQITGLAGLIQNAINDIVDGSETLTRIRNALQDVVQVINRLEVLSTLTIGKSFGDMEVFGVDNWDGLAIYWRWDCPQPIQPDCGRLPIRFDQLDLGILVGEWTGRVQGYDQLQIDRHPIDLRYGELILYVIEGVLFPVILEGCDPFDGPCNRIQIDDAIAQIIGCGALADFITGSGDCIRVFGIDVICRDAIENICSGFISVAFGGVLRNLIQSLRFDSVIDLAGRVTLVNQTPDLFVDLLEEGTYNGSIFLGNTPAPFTAPFCGISHSYDAQGGEAPMCRPQ